PNTPTTATYTLYLHDALPIFVNSKSSSSLSAVSMLMMHFCNFLHRSLPITSPPSAVNLTAISSSVMGSRGSPLGTSTRVECDLRSEEHTSELQSRENLVCRLL